MNFGISINEKMEHYLFEGSKIFALTLSPIKNNPALDAIVFLIVTYTSPNL